MPAPPPSTSRTRWATRSRRSSAGLFRAVFENVPNIHKARVSFHGQNDLGLCTANTLTAIQNGARQVEVTINGIGERAGNTSLEEVVMAIKTRKDFFGFDTDINTREIYRASKMVETYSGMPIQWNKAIVGKNAFRHGSGIHQDGILKLRETWEIMDPVEIGIPQGTQLVLGKLSGRHAFKQPHGRARLRADRRRAEPRLRRLQGTGRQEDGSRRPRPRSDRQRQHARRWRAPAGGWTLVQVTAGDHATPTATLRLIDPEGNIRTDAATGTGPVDAVYRAMNRITGLTPSLTEFA